MMASLYCKIYLHSFAVTGSSLVKFFLLANVKSSISDNHRFKLRFKLVVRVTFSLKEYFCNEPGFPQILGETLLKLQHWRC